VYEGGCLTNADAQAAEAVDRAIAELADFHLLASEGMEAGYHADYVGSHRHEYIRTVRDVLKHRPLSTDGTKVLELGAFFGVVCIALASLGYDVTAADIPEYIELPEQVERYARFGIKTKGVRLQDFVMPFDDEQFDVIIMCEVLEHLNFNPLPLLKEINRIGKPGSIFYVSMPNAGSIFHRFAVARGYAGGVQVAEFFEQLDPHNSLIANGHWREYTAAETRQMLEPLGFQIADQYFFSLGETLPPKGVKSSLFRRFMKMWPVFKENQTTIAVRQNRTNLVFDIPETVHPTLRSL
jgi:2-polyprenyl-3-methyl-5-hydroxy-6-metoxy-1,4-benzoquinol methylase